MLVGLATVGTEFVVTPLLTLRTSQGELDLLDAVAGIGGYDQVLAGSEEVEAFGLRIPALRLRELIVSKRATGRKTDLQQLPALDALLALKKDRGEER